MNVTAVMTFVRLAIDRSSCEFSSHSTSPVCGLSTMAAAARMSGIEVAEHVALPARGAGFLDRSRLSGQTCSLGRGGPRAFDGQTAARGRRRGGASGGDSRGCGLGGGAGLRRRAVRARRLLSGLSRRHTGAQGERQRRPDCQPPRAPSLQHLHPPADRTEVQNARDTTMISRAAAIGTDDLPARDHAVVVWGDAP